MPDPRGPRSDIHGHLKGPDRGPYLLIGAGGALIALCTILPWVHVIFLGSFNMFRLTSVAHSDGWIPVLAILAGLGIVAAVLAAQPVRHLAWASGAVAVLAVIAGWSGVGHLIAVVHASDGAVSGGLGLYAGIVAVILLAAGAVRALAVGREGVGLAANPPGRHSADADRLRAGARKLQANLAKWLARTPAGGGDGTKE